MNDQRSRGAKTGTNPPAPDDLRPEDANQTRPETATRQALHPKTPQTDDPSEAPESGTRDRPDDA